MPWRDSCTKNFCEKITCGIAFVVVFLTPIFFLGIFPPVIFSLKKSKIFFSRISILQWWVIQKWIYFYKDLVKNKIFEVIPINNHQTINGKIKNNILKSTQVPRILLWKIRKNLIIHKSIYCLLITSQRTGSNKIWTTRYDQCLEIKDIYIFQKIKIIQKIQKSFIFILVVL